MNAKGVTKLAASDIAQADHGESIMIDLDLA
jgi:hypothetical protein